MDNRNPVKRDPLALLGEKLRLAREGRSLDVGQVQKQTHINSRVIIALEDGRCDEVLTPTYVKGFLKKYAHFLGLDANEVLKEYSFAAGEGTGERGVRASEGSASYPALGRFAGIALIVIATALLVIVAVWLGKAAVKHAPPRKPARPAAPATREAFGANVRKGPFTLVIKAGGRVFIKAKKDGNAVFSRVFPKGFSESINADEKVDLFIADGSLVEIFINGKSMGSPGRGVMKDLVVTSLGIKKE